MRCLLRKVQPSAELDSEQELRPAQGVTRSPGRTVPAPGFRCEAGASRLSQWNLAVVKSETLFLDISLLVWLFGEIPGTEGRFRSNLPLFSDIRI